MTEFEHEWAAPNDLLPEPTRPCEHWIARTRDAEAEVKRLREAQTQDGYKVAALNAEVERLRECLAHESNYHWGPNGQRCECEECTMKRRLCDA
jgi:hypothetical protein